MPRPPAPGAASLASMPKAVHINDLDTLKRAEDKFWKDFHADQDALQDSAERQYQEASRSIRSELDTLSDQQSTLAKDRDELATGLDAVQTELNRNTEQYNSKAARLAELEQEFRKNDQKRLENKQRVSNALTKWFLQQRAAIVNSNAASASAAASWYPSPRRAGTADSGDVDASMDAGDMSDVSMPDRPPSAGPGPRPRGAYSKSSATGTSGRAAANGRNSNNTEKPRANNLRRITKANLLVKHNGKVYTAPPCIVGVPLEKVDPDHPYWDPIWPDQRSIIMETMTVYQNKLEAGMQKAKSRTVDFPGKAQLIQQIKRGEIDLDFIKNGEICMYQLLAKPYINPGGRGALVSTANMYRLCMTLQELRDYNIDVEPVDWLRQRLHEIIQDEGPKFNLSRVIGKFYQDPKLVQLRVESGGRNTGRPSIPKKEMAYKTKIKGARRAAAAGDSPRKARTARGFGSGASTERFTPYAAELSVDEDVLTDTDSFSGTPLTGTEWRLYQVKTRIHTTSDEMTQYWEWQPDARVFEHQVIRETEPKVLWAIMREPLDFEVSTEEIMSVTWNVPALRAQLHMTDKRLSSHDNKPRGDVLVAFKRATTMRRFLRFCDAEGIRIEKTSE